MAARAATEPTAATIHECLGTLVFGEEDDETEDAACGLLAARNATLATIEWGTSGLLAHWLGEATTSDRYVGGIVAASGGRGGRVIDAADEGGLAKPQAGAGWSRRIRSN